MSRKSRYEQRKRTAKLGTWKVVDDRSGFVISSTDAKFDHQGRLTSKDNWDPLWWGEMDIKYPVDVPIPFSRPEPPNNYVSLQNPYALSATYLDRWFPQVIGQQVTGFPGQSLNNAPPPFSLKQVPLNSTYPEGLINGLPLDQQTLPLDQMSLPLDQQNLTLSSNSPVFADYCQAPTFGPSINLGIPVLYCYPEFPEVDS